MAGSSSRGRVVVVLLLLLGVAAGVVSVTWWRRQMPRAIENRRLTQEQLERALTELQALEVKLEAAAREQGVGAELISQIQSFTSAHDTLPDAHRLLGQALVLDGQRKPALAAWARSIELQPGQPELALTAGTLAFEERDYIAAERYYDLARSIEPANARYNIHLAKAKMARQRDDEARQLLLNVLRADDRNDQAYATLAELYKKQNKLALALTQIDKAVDAATHAQSPQRLRYVLFKANILRSDNQPGQALLVLEALEEQERLKPETLEAMALCWAQQGDLTRAAAVYEKPFAAHPEHWGFAAGAARWKLRANDRAAAQRYIEEIRRINPRAPVIQQLQTQLRELAE